MFIHTFRVKFQSRNSCISKIINFRNVSVAVSDSINKYCELWSVTENVNNEKKKNREYIYKTWKA